MSQYTKGSQQKGFLKIIIIGDSGVGKSSLIEAFNYKKISKSAKPTIGAEFSKKKLRLNESGIEVNLQLWDTAGQERFQSLCTSFYRGSDGCILVFDISSAESYENLDKWRQVFQSTTGDETRQIPIVLVGNKIDCVNTIHRDQVINEWVKTNKAQAYIEASALKNIGIEDIFQSVAQNALDYQNSLKASIHDGFSHSIINIRQLGKSGSQVGGAGAASRVSTAGARGNAGQR